MTGPKFQFLAERPAIEVRKGFYFRSSRSGRRLYFSENEIAKIVPGFGKFFLLTRSGGEYEVRSSVPDLVEYEAPIRESVKGDHFFMRS